MIENTVEKYIAKVLSAKDLSVGLHSNTGARSNIDGLSTAGDIAKISSNRHAGSLPIAIISNPDKISKDYDTKLIHYQIDLIGRSKEELDEYGERLNFILSKVLELHHEDMKYTGTCEITNTKIEFNTKENVWRAKITLSVHITYAGRINIQ